MSLSDAEIADVVAELAPRLAGAAVGKVYQRDADTLVLELGRARLLLGTQARASRLHLEAEKPAGAGAPPSAFAMLLRKRLGGLRLATLAAEPGERVVALGFGAGRDRLVAELTGPHANVFLVDAGGAIVAALHRSASTTRVLAPGHPYAPPPAAPADARWRGRRRFAPPEVAAQVAAHYTALLGAAEEEALRARAGAALRRDLARVERRIQALGQDLARIAASAEFRKLADLLLAHLAEAPARGATSFTVPDDFTDGTPLTIPLEPALDARQNAARFYRQHKRLSAGRKHTDARLRDARAERDALRARLDALPALPLAALRRAAPAPAPRRRRPEPTERLPYREYRSASGAAIWVGRGAKDNDALTFRHARGGDLWLHTRDAPGAHVVVPQRSGAPASEETLLDAATLAVHHSPLAGETQADVHVAHVKNLRKAKGGAPGLVYVSEARTLRLRVEPTRLARLLGAPGNTDAD